MQECPSCQWNKVNNHPLMGQLQSIPPELGQVWGLDIVGPFPWICQSATQNILVIDYWSRLCMARMVGSVTSRHII